MSVWARAMVAANRAVAMPTPATTDIATGLSTKRKLRRAMR
jgi:hypothetical protein